MDQKYKEIDIYIYISNTFSNVSPSSSALNLFLIKYYILSLFILAFIDYS